MNAPLNTFLDHLAPADPVQVGPLVLVPLRLSAGAPLLDVALLGDETAEVSEVSEGGTVGRIRVSSRSKNPLLLIAGEILKGAKQDRLVNASQLVEPGGQLDIAVSCVEQGRWAFHGGRRFREAGVTAPWTLRSSASLRASRSKRRLGHHDADQGAVWADVRRHLRSKGVQSRTGNLMDDLEQINVAAIGSWEPDPADVGAVFFVSGALVGMEAFGSPAVWQAARRRVLLGLCAENPSSRFTPTRPGETATSLLQRLRETPIEEEPSEGLGTELHGESKRTHLTALCAPAAEPEPGDGPQDPPAVVHLRVARVDTGPDPSGARNDTEEGREATQRRRILEARRAEARAARHRETRSHRGRFRAWSQHTFEQRHLRQVQAQVERAQVATARTEAPVLKLGGPALVVPQSRYTWLLGRCLPEGPIPPLPHRIGGGLVAWRTDEPQVLTCIAEALTELGLPARLAWHASPNADNAPNWIRVRSTRHGTLRVHLAGE